MNMTIDQSRAFSDQQWTKIVKDMTIQEASTVFRCVQKFQAMIDVNKGSDFSQTGILGFLERQELLTFLGRVGPNIPLLALPDDEKSINRRILMAHRAKAEWFCAVNGKDFWDNHYKTHVLADPLQWLYERCVQLLDNWLRFRVREEQGSFGFWSWG